MAEIKLPKDIQEDEGMQQGIILYQLMQRQLEQIGAEAAVVERKMMEYTATRQSLAEMKRTDEMLIPSGSGCYMRGKMNDRERLLVEVGAGILLSKTPEEAGLFIEGKEAEVKKVADELSKQAEKIAGQMNSIITQMR